MSMKKIVYFVYSIIISFVCLGVVGAVSAPTVTADKDYVTVYSQGASLYYYSIYPDFGTAVSMSSKISLRNGTYYFWARGTGVGDGNLSAAGPTQYTVTTSCSNQSKLNAVGQGTVERCLIVDSNGNFKADSNQAIVSCASGYNLQNNKASVTYNGCSNLQIPVGGMRFCKVIYSYNCVKSSSQNPQPGNPQPPNPLPPNPQPEVPAAVLSSLNVDGYSISPAFSSGNRNYSLSVGSGVTSVNISATLGSGANFVSGYGPRSVNLNYGSNNVAVKVQNSVGSVTVYTININRADGRNADNTLKSLSVDKGKFTPDFNANTTYYYMELAEKDQEVKINAELNHSSASFVEGYGPRTVKLALGVNTLYVKVKNERGNVKVYTINIVSGTGSSQCNLSPDELPLLKEIEFISPSEDVVIPKIENFDSAVYQYNGIKVPYSVEDLDIKAYTKHEGDTVTIEGNEGLEVNVPANIVIKVTSKACPTTTLEYNIEVTRQPEGEVSSDAGVEDIIIKGADGKTVYDIDFKQNVKTYDITVNKGETKLNFFVEKSDPGAEVSITEPERFGKGAKYIVTVTSSDGASSVDYTIRIAKVKSGANVFLIAILIIILILILIYGVLRLLGYRIYFNTAMLGAFFRGMGSKDKFDK